MRLRTALFLMSLPLWGQWTKVPLETIPRTADGKPNLSAPAPRLPDGKPDLSGVWSPNANKYLRDIAVDLKPGEVPYQPWAKALYESRVDGSHSKEDPDANCLPQGVPKIDAAPAPWKIVQTPRTVIGQLGFLTSSAIRTPIDQGAPGTLATTYFTNQLNQNVPFFTNPYILGANLTGNYSNSTYNALQTEVRHRYRSGLQFLANYTYSKALSDSLGDQQSRFEPFLDATNPSLERARVPYDLTHVFNFNGSYELPFGTGHRFLSSNAILSRIVGGWRLASTVTWQSGSPFSILSLRGTLNRSGNRSAQNTASTTLTGDQLDSVVGLYMTGNGPYFINPANITPDGRGTVQEGQTAFSGQAFTNPGPGSVGTLQRRFFNNPSAFGLDGSIQKVTRITENHTIEFRAEAVNALNHSTFYTGESFNGGAPQSFFNINSTTFGRVNNSFFGARIMQFGLRYRF